MNEIDRLREKMRQDIEDACLRQLAKKRAEYRAELPTPGMLRRLASAVGVHPLTSDAEPLPTEDVIHQFAEIIARDAVPAAAARIAVQQGPFAVGASRLSGSPDMPAGMDWPSHKGQPLAFLAQVDLATLPAGIDWPVPRRGWLYFFLGDDDGGNELHPHHVTKFFDGQIDELSLRPVPTGTVVNTGLAKAVPYSMTFELSLSSSIMNARTQVELMTSPMLPNLDKLDTLHLLLSAKPVVIPDNRDCMFGMRRDDQNNDTRFPAAAMAAGFQDVMHLASMSLDRYRELAAKRPAAFPPIARFELLKEQQQSLIKEAQHWGPLFMLGSHLHGSTGGGDDTWHFKWWDAQTLQIFADLRKSVRGDFSGTSMLIAD